MTTVEVFQLSDHYRVIGDRGIVEWTPGHWWAVEVTDPDRSFTPLYQGKGKGYLCRLDAERWVRAHPAPDRAG
jgi:hypothetical protein